MRVTGRGTRLAVLGLSVVVLALPAAATAREQAVVAARPSAEAPALRPHYVAGEVIVEFKDVQPKGIAALSEDAAVRTDQASLLRLQAKYGLQNAGPVFKRVHEQLRRGTPQGRLGIASVGKTDAASRRSQAMLRFYVLKADRDVEVVCRELNADPAVRHAQPNYIYYPCRMPNDPDFADQYAHQLIRMEDAWEISTGSRDIVVAVLGTGVDVNHPDLKDNIWINKGEIAGNQIDDDENGFVDDVHGWNFDDSNGNVTPLRGSVEDISSHETQVAGVIGAVGNNGEGVCGVNWQCSIMALRLSLSYTSDEVAGGLDYAAANGARVINMSFGGDVFGPEGDQVVKAAIDHAYEQGVLLVASAGNSDTSRPNYPAAYPNVLAVASTNAEDMKTGHSSFGFWVDIAAPGTDIVTTYPGDEYIATAGTSFSAPYVAAVAALVLSHRPELTDMQVRAILENTVDPIDYGDMDPNLVYIGTGRVNAHQALLGADRSYPLGEIAAPEPKRTYAADANAIEVRLFVHGDAYRLDYRGDSRSDWMAISEGTILQDANGVVAVSLPNPGVGTYELRLLVTRGPYTHVDRKVFAVNAATSQAHWPKPLDPDDEDYYWIYFMGSPLCLDVNGDRCNEIVQPSVDYRSLQGGGMVNLWDQDGNPLPGWPVEMESAWPTSTAVGDIDGDGDYEVVVACEYDGEVYAYHVQSGRIVEGDWPASVGGWLGWIPSGPVLADLDGDGDSEILIALDMEGSDIDGLIALQGDGSFLWQRRYTSTGPISVADLDQDGDAEIALSGYGPGLSRLYTFILDHRGQQIARVLGGGPLGTAVGDLDADGKPEVVFCTDKEVMAIRTTGSTAWKTGVSDPLDGGGGLCIGDLNGDGLGEVYVNIVVKANEFTFSRVYAFDHKGRLLTEAGYPKTIMGDPDRCVPLIADIDGDGQKELIVASAGEPIAAWESDGSVTRGFPLLALSADYQCTPALADLDRDGDLEILVPSDDYRFHVLDLPVPYAAEKIDWGMVRHDPQNSGWLAAVPQIEPGSVPAQITAGQRLEIQLSASNRAHLPLRWLVGDLPQGAHYDAASATISWEPSADQVFQSYRFAFAVTDGIRQDSVTASVEVLSNAIYHASMSTDPNWSLGGLWAWGALSDTGGTRNADPRASHTGQNVVAFVLSGNYASNMPGTFHATTPPIDCRGFQDIRLGFWRWLTVESPNDKAYLQVSNDGATWTDLWTAGQSAVMDEAWQYVEYAVPADIGDDRPTVYFRWGLGPTNKTITYGGWSIDDVQVTGTRQ